MKKLFKDNSKKAGNSVEIMGVRLTSTSMSSLLGKIEQRIDEAKKTFVVTPNPEFIVFAHKNPWFKEILNQADIAIPDGVGLVWASRFLQRYVVTGPVAGSSRPTASPSTSLGVQALDGTPSVRATRRSCQPCKVSPCGVKAGSSRTSLIKERISGIDLMERLCALSAKRGWSLYLLGGQSGIARRVLVRLKERFPGLKGWAEAGPALRLEAGSEDTSDGGRPSLRGHDSSEVEELVENINQKHPDLLFVALGMGKQEKFIYDNWRKLNVKLAMGVGGAFDYLSKRIPRAPKWMQKLGLEWLYRLLREPWRWQRQLALVKFVGLVMRQKRVKINDLGQKANND